MLVKKLLCSALEHLCTVGCKAGIACLVATFCKGCGRGQMPVWRETTISSGSSRTPMATVFLEEFYVFLGLERLECLDDTRRIGQASAARLFDPRRAVIISVEDDAAVADDNLFEQVLQSVVEFLFGYIFKY